MKTTKSLIFLSGSEKPIVCLTMGVTTIQIPPLLSCVTRERTKECLAIGRADVTMCRLDCTIGMTNCVHFCVMIGNNFCT